MGKQKGKPNKKNDILLKNRDSLLRMNYLRQASQLVLLKNENKTLSDFYNHNMIKIAAKNVLRLSPEVKHSVCKSCFSLLIPGKSSTVRVQSKRSPHIVMKCGNCLDGKRFNIKNQEEKKQ
eukprot:TRINITY_DN5878_c0_g2_i1.p1 TRINITY_DN5878_c0_g2~~TRINITY_DN5878_c0_g2_i1.p1  ORF type:complete len:121 (+),score=21.44 TRINITY_DN5878_c0_g2_i1:3-365(+)